MDLTKILSISGKPGLFLMVGDAKDKIIIESLMDGKRYPAFSHDKISSLKEISIYTETDDLPLEEAFKNLFKALDGKLIENPKKMPSADLKALFEQAVPKYDKESVYVSNMKSVFTWYNILVEKNLIDFEEALKAEDTTESKEVKEDSPKEA
ncbi:MAG: hypothetical protein DRJ09_03080 [Bacteroidetes bacterium]|nr:MAG: hypothetical protein DRJ09_03080 [Bacteroidota bacterium]